MNVGSNFRFTRGLLTVFGQDEAEEITSFNLPKSGAIELFALAALITSEFVES